MKYALMKTIMKVWHATCWLLKLVHIHKVLINGPIFILLLRKSI